MVIKFITDKMFSILKKYCFGGDDFLNIYATTEVSKLTLCIKKITGYFYVTEQLMISFTFIRDQSYVVAVCCTPHIDAITQTLFISGNSSVLKFISKFVLLTHFTLNCVWCQHVSILVTSTHYLPFYYSQYKHFETRIFKAVSSPTFRYETCVKKLQLLSSCKPSVASEAHTRHTEREDLRDKVEQVIQRIEEAKENSYVILRTKVQVCMYVCNIKAAISSAILLAFYAILHTVMFGLSLFSHVFLNPILIFVYIFSSSIL